MENHQVKPSKLSPLWVISLFVSLTEVVTGIAVTQATNGIQIALTSFVILFPLLVASAFFIILWNRPYVFYPPNEFANGVDVSKYVEAMAPKVENLKADLEAELENIKARIDIEFQSIQEKNKDLSEYLFEVSSQSEKTKLAFSDFKKELDSKKKSVSVILTDFMTNSVFRIHIVHVTKDPATEKEKMLANSLVSQLQKKGYKTSTGGWGSSFYLSTFKSKKLWKDIKIIALNDDTSLVNKVSNIVKNSVDIPVSIISKAEFENSSNRDGMLSKSIPENTDLVIAHCIN